MILPYVDIRTASVAAGATSALITLAPRDRRLNLRLRHLHLHSTIGAAAPAVNARLSTNIPGLSELNGLPVCSVSHMILPLFHDLRGDARGTLAIENLTAGAGFLTLGLDGYYLKSIEDELELRPALASPSFVRSSATASVGTAPVELLRFQVPNYRGGVVISGVQPIETGAFARSTIYFEGPGLESVGPITVQQARLFPFALWLPPLAMCRVLMSRDTGGASNSAITIYGHGLP